MKVVLISTYELGRQPFGLASPSAWLQRAGAEVVCLDLSVEELQREALRLADLIAFYLPMHTATRKAVQILEQVKRINPAAPVCFYGLYAPMNVEFLRSLGADAVLGGEFEEGLVRWMQHWAEVTVQRSQEKASLLSGDLANSESFLAARRAAPTFASGAAASISLARQQFIPPDRASLPPLKRYARLNLPNGQQRIVGYTEASRGCKHLCRHCPVVPVYQGHFRIVQPGIVLADIATQVEMGAEHITFGDPDFFNGVGHTIPLVQSVHRNFPKLSYDVTIKIEHLRQHSRHLETLRDTGCLFVTSAVESINDRVLQLLEKGHTRHDFLEALQRLRAVGLPLSPTFIPFTPWATRQTYGELLALLEDEDLVEHVSPIQLAIRLLIPAQSRLLELEEVRRLAGSFNPESLSYKWTHADPWMDELQSKIVRFVAAAESRKLPRQTIFDGIRDIAGQPGSDGLSARSRLPQTAAAVVAAPKGMCVSGLDPLQPAASTPSPPPPETCSPRAAIPHLTEPWYCCAEPVEEPAALI